MYHAKPKNSETIDSDDLQLERDLMIRLQAGDEDAFVELYRRKRDEVYRFVVGLSGSKSIADDVAQEVFLNVLEHPSRFDDTKGTLRAWLLGTARHKTIDRMRKIAKHAVLNGEPGASSCIGEDAVFRNQRLNRLHEEIAQLPPAYRDALVLCDLLELSYAESAHVMSCPVGTVRSRLHRARLLLTNKLDVEHEDATKAATPLFSQKD